MKRSSFLAATGGSIDAAAAPARAAQAGPRTGRKALVLVGGANRGAYQAGVVQALVEKHGLRDGDPLGYDLVCGASIGSLNTYLVSTAPVLHAQKRLARNTVKPQHFSTKTSLR